MKIKLIYKDQSGEVKELTLEVPDDSNIDQCLKNLYGWTVENY